MQYRIYEGFENNSFTGTDNAIVVSFDAETLEEAENMLHQIQSQAIGRYFYLEESDQWQVVNSKQE